jgi:hypothetical protein
MEIFPPREIDRQPTTVYHAIHHNFTTKTPRQTPTLSQHPPQKTPTKHQKPPFPATHKFLRNKEV